MTDTMTIAQIRMCLEANDFGLYVDDDDACEWDREAEQYERGALIAFTGIYTDLTGGPQELDCTDFFEAFVDTYKGRWNRPGYFAQYETEQRAEMGSNPKGRVEFLKEFADYIDWDAYADSTELSDFTMVEVGPAVYVFEPDV